MREVRTEPLKAENVSDKETFLKDRRPGSFRVTGLDAYGEGDGSFWYCCPCGCKSVAPLYIGNGFKPSGGPSWSWNGSTDAPTLEPSVNHVGHWHGWLRAGVWTSC